MIRIDLLSANRRQARAVLDVYRDEIAAKERRRALTCAAITGETIHQRCRREAVQHVNRKLGFWGGYKYGEYQHDMRARWGREVLDETIRLLKLHGITVEGADGPGQVRDKSGTTTGAKP